MKKLGWQYGLVAAGLGLCIAGTACDDNTDKNGTGGQTNTGGSVGGGGTGGTGNGGQAGSGLGGHAGSSEVSQTPPKGATALEAWLATGAYKSWHCESTPHASRSPSPHGFNRICTNDLLSSMATASGPWPKGAAAVKELFASGTDAAPGGYAVYLKTDVDSAEGANWYWYERLPSSSTPVADGLGDSGTAKSICVGCHVAAGSDAAHTPTAGGRDQVYTPVP